MTRLPALLAAAAGFLLVSYLRGVSWLQGGDDEPLTPEPPVEVDDEMVRRALRVLTPAFHPGLQDPGALVSDALHAALGEAIGDVAAHLTVKGDDRA